MDMRDLMVPTLDGSRYRKLLYRFANADHRDIACHSDRSRWTRAATALTLYFLYASFGTYTFLRALESVSLGMCIAGALLVAGGIISFDRGVLGTTNANMTGIGAPDPADPDPGGTLQRAHANPVRSTSGWLVLSRVILAMLMAIVVTEQLNAAVFHNQINHQLHQQHLGEAQQLLKSATGPIAKGRTEIQEARATLVPLSHSVRHIGGNVSHYDRRAVEASKGHDTTGKVGCGGECKFWLSRRDQARGELHRAETKLNLESTRVQGVVSGIRHRAEAAQQEAEGAIGHDRGGLSDTLGLYAYLSNNPRGLLLFVPLTLMLLALDLAALLYKLAGKNSLYKRRQALRIRLLWQGDVTATQPLNQRAVSAAQTTSTAHTTAREMLREQIAATKRDPEVKRTLREVARGMVLHHIDRRRSKRTAQPGKERRRGDGQEEPPPKQAEPLRHFPQRSSGSGRFELINLVPGTVVTGQRSWRLDRQLPAERQGGHSVVFEATEVGGAERVVIKFMYIPRAHASDVADIVRERALRELRNVGQLPRSNFIVPAVDKVLEISEGALWLATPLAAYGSLATFYRDAKRRSRSAREVVMVAGQVAAALNQAYAASYLVHRDIKPANILVFSLEPREEDGPGFTVPRVKVTDWALSRIESLMEGTLDIGPAGTLWFAAPQAHDMQATDRRDDLFALGCLIWWLIVGEPPLYAELGSKATDQDISELVRRRQEAPRFWDDLRYWQPGIPVELATLVSHLIAYDRDLRAPNVENSLHWVEMQLKSILDKLDEETRRTGTEIMVGPACEPPGIRNEIFGDSGLHGNEDDWPSAGHQPGPVTEPTMSEAHTADDDEAETGPQGPWPQLPPGPQGPPGPRGRWVLSCRRRFRGLSRRRGLRVLRGRLNQPIKRPSIPRQTTTSRPWKSPPPRPLWTPLPAPARAGSRHVGWGRRPVPASRRRAELFVTASTTRRCWQ